MSAHTDAKPSRDVRLDFFRGLALCFIFLNHIPENVVSWVSNRNFGFSDATEIFVFVSGYSVILAFNSGYARVGWMLTAARILRRVWQIYTAHIFLFMVFVANIAFVADRFNPVFADEMGISHLLDAPHILLLQALLLKFKPVNMDVLPLYIVLLLAFPLLLPLLRRWPNAVLACSFALWAAVQVTHWNLPAYPSGGWYFNPLAWQLLFVIGAWCAVKRQSAPWRRLPARLFAPLSVLYLVFALAVVATWEFPALEHYMPGWLQQLIYPVVKTNLDAVRLLHFLAQAYLVVYFVPIDAAFLRWRAARPLIRCGSHSLEVFCLSVFLSFGGYFVLQEVDSGYPAQILVSAAGIGLMIGLAELMTLYRRYNSDLKGDVAPQVRPDLTGSRT